MNEKLEMSEAQRLARIQLCGTHEFSLEEWEKNPSPFLKCKNGCGLEWGEISSLQLKFKLIVELK